MENKFIIIDPRIILNPTNFALHLCAFTNNETRIRIPIGWLWEELSKRYSLINLADCLLFYTDNSESGFNLALEDSNTVSCDTSIALISIANKLGLIDFIATPDYLHYLENEPWAGYFLDLINNNIKSEIITVDYYEKAKKIALEIVSEKFGMKINTVKDIYDRNRYWEYRSEDDYIIFENTRRIYVNLSQLFLCFSSGYSLLSNSCELISLIKKEFYNKNLIKINKQHSIHPYLTKLKQKPSSFTVGDIVKMIENQDVLKKFAELDMIIEKVRLNEEKKKLHKNAILYLFGLIPFVGTLTNIIELYQLANDYIEHYHKKNDELIIYDDMNYEII